MQNSQIVMEDPEKIDIVRAKQAISPAGLSDRSDKASTMPGNNSPADTPIDDLRMTPTRDDIGEDDDEPTTHHNRNRDGKVDIGKGSYS